MSKFIEFNDANYPTGILINTDIIDFIISTGKGARIVLSRPLHGTDRSEFQTFEYSYDELKEILTNTCRSDKEKKR